MIQKGFPFSQFQLVGAVTTAITNRMFRWGSTENQLTQVDGNNAAELANLYAFVQAGNFMIQTLPDECGELTFKVGDDVVERASGIFAQLYKITSMDKGLITITDDSKSVVVHAGRLRGDGIAFLPSNVKQNDINLSGLPISDDDLIRAFLFITLSQGGSSNAWTELRYIAEVPNQEGLEDMAGWNFYEACKVWAREYAEKSLPKFNINDIVCHTFMYNVLSGDYGVRNEPFIGRVVHTGEIDSSGMSRLVVQSAEGGTKRICPWDVIRISNSKSIV